MSALGTGTWTILESVAGTSGTAALSSGDTVLNHGGAPIASAAVCSVNSFEITFGDQLEDSAIGIAYFGLTVFFGLIRRRG